MYQFFYCNSLSEAVDTASLKPTCSLRHAKLAHYSFSVILIFLSCILGALPVLANAASGTVIRINAGGGNYTDSAGNVWLADTGYNTGSKASTSSPISGTTNDVLFQRNRWDEKSAPELEYSFPVPNGDYTVNLHFAESYERVFGTGLRVFHVNIEGQRVLNDLDIYREVGANKALTKSFSVKVSDGKLNIQFLHKIQNPHISAIEILGISSLVPDNGIVNIDANASATINVLAGKKGTVTIVDKPSQGTASVQADNTILYTPKDGYVGQDTLTYKITGPDGSITIATLTVKVGCTQCSADVNLTLTWKPSAGDVLGYRIYYGPTSGTVTQQLSDLYIATGEVDARTPAVTYNATNHLGMRSGDSVCFKVKAYNAEGESGFSTPACTNI